METQALWPLVLYFALVLFVVVVMIGVPALLAPRHMDRATGEPYESGIATTGSARVRIDTKFYLIAMFFVIFDLEAVFLFAWAVALRELGWLGYLEATVFVLVLLASLVYLWKVGGLEWSPRPRRGQRLKQPE